MARIISFIAFVFLFLCLNLNVSAQTEENTIFTDVKDSLYVPEVVPDSGSIITEMQKELEESRLEQMNLLMEIEQMKMANIVADSIKLAEQKAVIDSLRQITNGIPVTVEEDTLFYIYANRGGHTPQQRAKQTGKTIENIGKEYGVTPDSVFILSEEFTSDIMYKNTVIISLADKDGMWMNLSRDELAKHDREIIVKTLHELKDRHSLMRLLKRLSLFALVIALQITLIWFTNYGHRKLRKTLHESKQKFLKPLYIKDYEFLSTVREEKIMFFFLNILRWIIIIMQFIISIPILFSIFPQTEDLAMTLFSYISVPIKSMGKSIINYIPNVFSIIIVWLVIRYVVKGIGYLAKEIENERLKISNFYPDWAQPTFSIIRFLMYAFMIALIYPLLPGSDSKVFQGISVFVGLIVSFGSSSAIGNLISGIIITYMRPFKIGDRIKIQDIIGNVIEKTPIVTRVRTLKNEIITVPNSMIMNSQSTNLSESARTVGLIIYLDTTMGYEVPWRKVHELLIDSALKTEGVMTTPHPFVLETSFDDFYVTYQINAYINDADQLSSITTSLRQNIQDTFKNAGLNIMSPHYYAQYKEKENSQENVKP
jgi:Small-conductance mechanosensitive channel